MAVVPFDVVIPRKIADEMIRCTDEACIALGDCHNLQENICSAGWTESKLVALHLRRTTADKAMLRLLELVIDNVKRK
ncbi:MAG: hypothetical protein J5497_01885 [Selenomonadaceae bacterium]|nr:hypothetical protein [Selenomonadaceae bacterium]